MQDTDQLLNCLRSSLAKAMQSSKLTDQSQSLITHIQSGLHGIGELHIKDFSKTLFPVFNCTNPYQGLNSAMTNFYTIRLKKQIDFAEITKEIIAKSQQYGNGMKEAMGKLLKDQFLDKFKAKLAEKESHKNGNLASNKQHKEEKKTNDVVIVDSIKTKDIGKHKDSGSTKSGTHKKTHPPGSSDIDYVNNLADRGICLCQKEVSSLENTFVCIHCGYNFHLECMKKKAGARYCSMCHLKCMLPNKVTHKILFLGVLKKSKKRHQFNIYLSEQDLSMKYKLQIRCFRLKQATQSFALFPDYTNIHINNYSVKQFAPLHRQSSLKYRKDEPFYAQIKHLLPKDNKVVIHQKLPTKQNKDERIEVQNHLIGFFMVQQKRIQNLVKQISSQSLTSFDQSRKILQSAFRIGNCGNNDEVTCQVVKIPLTCSLSTEKIKLPARGMFCNHFQCFDLNTFMMMISSSSNPKWLCPLCKQPCYFFRIDCILTAIFEEYSKYSVTEVMFFKTGEFTIHAGEKMIKQRISNIYQLPKLDQNKRQLEPVQQPQRKKKKPTTIPQSSKVISLDE